MPPSDLAAPTLAEQAGTHFAFQPYVDVVRQSVVGHEALYRGPQGESADRMLARVSGAEQVALDQQLRLQALAEAERAGIVRQGHHLSVNVLATGIGNNAEGFLATLDAAQRLGISSNRLVLEITEINELVDASSLRSVLQELRTLGFRTAIDDLGRGWSNLKLLAQLQPDIVKFDRAFIRDIDTENSCRSVVRHMKGLCDDLGCEIIAEGVEKREESTTLEALGIHLQQGFLFSRPVLGELNLNPFFPERN